MSRTFRLFISSTFNDFKEERELLHKEVFPELEQYCESRGYQFQPIDLRWGVNSEAQLDQKTLQVCLDEVRACKHYPHPNFLIMVGERYGWIPLPYAIEKEEFENIIAYHKRKDTSGLYLRSYPIDKATLIHWYKLDKNQFPASYLLRPRSDENNTSHSNLRWNIDEAILLKALQESVKALYVNHQITLEAYEKYFLSATEQEVIEGVCDYNKLTKVQEVDDICKDEKHEIEKQYIHGYLRDVEFQEPLDDKLKEFRSNLTDTLLLGNIITGNSAQDFAKEITKRLKAAINAADIHDDNDDLIAQQLKNERSEQLAFRRAKKKVFVGRIKTLEAIGEYLVTLNSQPFVLYGASGMGKSTVMAEAIEKHAVPENNLIYRFVGATEYSRDIRSLLISITEDLVAQECIGPIKKYERRR